MRIDLSWQNSDSSPKSFVEEESCERDIMTNIPLTIPIGLL